ncbi:peptidoglycan DD-metalloendopeptidase family protein [Burkholderia cepacia]|uniref:peptidoglycan DD-metalloendopeptidase family protein n=1 Tax=Burkholderia cepacia TaxID=292 RepID=UPI001CF59112|nr:peptidoglycan DD-metalloendopeptidase family protein [Burkholderia cepacia]MCA8349725.1 M23 family metallopeptidase [Burkholderia cepacia]
MLISLPFLRVPKPRTDDDQNDGTFGLGEKSGKGAFPVSHQFGWHGGVHLVAPGGDANPEPVRAIADGEIVYARPSAPKPKTTPTGEERDANPLYYYAGWTSNGVVILRHRTEIGEGVEVVFYSIYQHLSTVAKADWKSGDKVYRKDPIGKAGDIYGKSNRIHFEIVADKANVERLMGRSEGKLEVAEGRRSCVWGDMHIVIPAGVPLYAVNPRTETRKYVVRAFNSTVGATNDTLESVAQRFRTTPARILALNGKTEAQAGDWWPKVTGAYQIAMASATKPLSLPTDAQRTIRVPAVYGAAAATPPDDLTAEVWAQWTVRPIGRTKEALIVTLSEARGDITLITRDVTGERRGNVSEPQGGYNLYKTAVDTYPGCPSAGYEMLRFGRILGPDAPAATDLHEGRLPHFRKIALDGSTTAFVDLNCAGTKAYSDADFPHWQGWTFIDDDTDGNSRCDSMQLLDLIEPMPAMPPEVAQGAATVIDAATQHRGRLIRAYAKAQTGEMRERLSYCVVKMPSEWARDDFDKRWSWLKGAEGESAIANIVFPICLGDPAYERLKRHHQALAFWEDAVEKGLTLEKEHYHFHPMKFIDFFKKCDWLSVREQSQLLPRSSMPDAGGANLSWTESRKRFLSGNSTGSVTSPPGLGLAINHTFRKYGFSTPLRRAHFLAQCFKESGALKWTAELGDASYFRKMYEVYTSEEAANDFDNRHQWLATMGFLKNRDRATYIAKRPDEIHKKALDGGNIQAGDGSRFRGRGLIHLTWRNGYRNYGKYRNLDFTTDPNPERVQSDAEVAADSAGYFWVMRRIHPSADRGATNDDVKRCFSLVGGAGGLAERQQFFRYTHFIMNDLPDMPIESGLKRQLED